MAILARSSGYESPSQHASFAEMGAFYAPTNGANFYAPPSHKPYGYQPTPPSAYGKPHPSAAAGLKPSSHSAGSLPHIMQQQQQRRVQQQQQQEQARYPGGVAAPKGAKTEDWAFADEPSAHGLLVLIETRSEAAFLQRASRMAALPTAMRRSAGAKSRPASCSRLHRLKNTQHPSSPTRCPLEAQYRL